MFDELKEDKLTMNDQTLPVIEETEDNEVYVNFDIASYPSDLPLQVVAQMFTDGELVIPDYQRNFVWSIKQASLLIESFLLGLPVPQIFLYVDQDNRFEVIDGQQRITSITYFINGFFGEESLHGKKQVFRLKGLDEQSPYANKSFDELEPAAQRKLRSAVLRAINIKQLSPKGGNTSVYHIFERLNTGGTPLKPQEIRNCVFRGKIVQLLQELNTYHSWRNIIGRATLDIHQKDVELVLRIFSLTNNLSSYAKPMKEFLNREMETNREWATERCQEFESKFRKACDIIFSHLGEKPFHAKGPLNSSILDSVMCTIIENIENLPADLRDRYVTLVNDPEYEKTTYISTSDKEVVDKRFHFARKALVG